MYFQHPINRPFPRVVWVYEGKPESGELIGVDPDNTVGIALTSRGFTRHLLLSRFIPEPSPEEDQRFRDAVSQKAWLKLSVSFLHPSTSGEDYWCALFREITGVRVEAPLLHDRSGVLREWARVERGWPGVVAAMPDTSR